MSDSDKKKPNRRDFILTATTAAGAVGVGAAVWPLIDQMNPDASVKALASTEVDISLCNNHDESEVLILKLECQIYCSRLPPFFMYGLDFSFLLMTAKRIGNIG